MKHALFIILASLAALLAIRYFGALLNGTVALLLILFGGGLATAGLYYLDLRREGRTNQNQMEHKE